jgi:excisionase family DNA binding protein
VDESRDRLERLTTAQAASRLGISEGGVRKRVQRGQMPYERDETGRLWVYLDTSATEGQKSRDRDRTSRDSHASEPLLSQMQAQIDSLERQLEQANERDRENRRIIAALTSRIPELPAASSAPRESPEMADDEQQGRGPTPEAGGHQEGTERRSWWREFLGMD